jgi:hypothetical protein
MYDLFSVLCLVSECAEDLHNRILITVSLRLLGLLTISPKVYLDRCWLWSSVHVRHQNQRSAFRSNVYVTDRLTVLSVYIS